MAGMSLMHPSRRTAVTTVAATFLWIGCGGGPPISPGPGPSPGPVFQQHTSTHFVFQFTPLDAASVAGTAVRLEAEYARIVDDLQPPQMAPINVFLYPDFASMQAAVQGSIGSLPSFATGLVLGPVSIHILSPNLAGTWSYDEGVVAIVHEFAHCVSLRVNPSIANNPRWLWETVAVFESRQFVHPTSVPSLAAGPPSVARLNGFDNTEVYSVGFVIGEFIVSRWGREGLVSLIRGNGNTTAALGISEAEFFSAWYDFVRGRYFAP